MVTRQQLAQLDSQFAANTAATLDRAGIPYRVGGLVIDLPLPYGGRMTFKPDLVLPRSPVNRKTVLLEPHGHQLFDSEFLEKLGTFMGSDTHDEFHLVVLTDVLKNEGNRRSDSYKRRVERELAGINYPICDEFWMVPGWPKTSSWGPRTPLKRRGEPEPNDKLLPKLNELKLRLYGPQQHVTEMLRTGVEPTPIAPFAQPAYGLPSDIGIPLHI